MQQADDFRDESLALHAILDPLDERHFTAPTGFKNWTINDILQHLHYFNWMAHLSLTDADAFTTEYAAMNRHSEGGNNLVKAVALRLPEGLVGRKLLDTWRDYLDPMTADFASADPKARVKWAGPDMSARSSITARLMETWAHGHEIYDLLGLERQDQDRIRNIAHLGVNTFGWTFINRGEEVPQPMPHVRLTAPSGEVWEWGEPHVDRVIGTASDFCHVVCQTRNVADTAIRTEGPVAQRWMALAQCFAGPPRTPPAPGTRTKGPGLSSTH
ncbi:MAG: TIGR03084 family metal-binding protein [Pseudomonadota bacterium]